MARAFSSGWEYSGTTDGGAWDGTSGTSITATAASARSGSYGLRVNPPNAQTNFTTKRIGTNANLNDWHIRTYVRIETVVSTLNQILIVTDVVGSGFSVASIKMNTNRTLELWNEGAVVPVQIGADSPVLALNTWYRVELSFIFVTKGLTAFLDGVSFASGLGDIQATSIDTLELGVGIDAASSGEVWFDDLAVNTGIMPNQFGLPGVGSLVRLFPNADGDNAMGSRGGTDSGFDWGQLDEDPPNDLTDYYILDVNNDIIDVRPIAASLLIPAGSTITLVHVGLRHRPASAAEMSYQARVKSQSGGTVQAGTLTTHNDVTWKTNGDVLPRNYTLTSYTDPQSVLNPWTIALLDTAQIGVIAIDADPDVWVTALWALVEYVEPATRLQDPILGVGVTPFPR